MDRRPRALIALLLFVVLTGAAIAVSAARPANDQGPLPFVLQSLGYLCALVAGILLLLGRDPGGRRTGAVVLAALVAFLVLDRLTIDQEGADIGTGLGRLVLLLVLGVATARLSVAVAADRRSTP